MEIDINKIKTWCITGASSGLGYYLSTRLLENNYNIIALSRQKANLNSKNALIVQCDITSPEDVDKAIHTGINHYGNIDVLVNNAGITSFYTFEESTNADLENIFKINFFGTCNVIRSCTPHFRNKGYGTIINISSMHGLTPRLNGSGYCSTKYAIEGLTDVLRLEMQNFCRVMAVEYGYFPNTNIGKIATKKRNKVF